MCGFCSVILQSGTFFHLSVKPDKNDCFHTIRCRCMECNALGCPLAGSSRFLLPLPVAWQPLTDDKNPGSHLRKSHAHKPTFNGSDVVDDRQVSAAGQSQTVNQSHAKRSEQSPVCCRNLCILVVSKFHSKKSKQSINK